MPRKNRPTKFPKLESGQRFHRLVFVRYEKKKAYWLCLACGKEKRIKASYVKTGKYKTCGCVGRNNQFKLARHSDPNYCWYIIMERIALRCRKIKKVCTINESYLSALYAKQGNKCAYTGVYIRLPKSFTDLYKPDILSVDRIDSTQGYIPGNIQLVTKTINFMKQALSHDEFIKLCCIVAEKAKLNLAA